MVAVGVNTLRRNLSVVLKEVEKGENISITYRGQEIALLVPTGNKMEKARKALQELRKTAFVGDVISPFTEEWELQ